MLQSLISRLSVLLAVATLALLAPQSKASSALYVETPLGLVDIIDRKNTGSNGELIDATAAYFGSNFYQSLVSGNLVLADEGFMDDGEPATFGCGKSARASFNVSSNEKWQQLSKDSNGRPSVILLIKRGSLPDIGSCPFDRKVLNAQQADGGGVVGVIVYDPSETAKIRMVDRGLGDLIKIPSFFLNQEYNDDSGKENLLAAWVRSKSPAQAWQTEMSFEFYLPNPDGRVELEYWYNVADDDALPFMTTFGAVARELVGKLLIQPKQFIAERPSCSDAPDECENPCLLTRTNGQPARYWCSQKTSPPSKFGTVLGKDIVREAVRQMCLYDALLASGDAGETNRDNVWMWRYWELFYTFDGQNALTETDWKDYNDKRVRQIFEWMLLMGMPSTISYQGVSSCMRRVTVNGEVTMLEKMTKEWDELGPSKRLSVYINDFEYYGSPRCPTPITQGTCGILSGICYGYANGTEPAGCLQDQNCPFGQSNCGGTTNIDNSVLGVSAGAVVGIVIAFLIVVGIVVWFYLRHYKQRMRADVDVLLQQYLPMDPGATHGVQSRTRMREAQEKRLISDIDLEDQALETRGL